MAAQSSASFPIFCGHPTQSGRNFGALAKIHWRTATPLLKKYSPNCEKIWSFFFEIAAPEIEEIVIGQKELKVFTKVV